MYRSYNPEYCKELVWHDRCGTVQCSRKVKKDKYCTQHHPDAKAARNAKRDARWKKDREADNQRRALQNAKDMVIVCAEKFTESGESAHEAAQCYDDLVAALDAMHKAQEAIRDGQG